VTNRPDFNNGQDRLNDFGGIQGRDANEPGRRHLPSAILHHRFYWLTGGKDGHVEGLGLGYGSNPGFNALSQGQDGEVPPREFFGRQLDEQAVPINVCIRPWVSWH
jgi:hypothetical protein